MALDEKYASPQEMMKFIRRVAVITSRRYIVSKSVVEEDLVQQLHFEAKRLGDKHISPWER
ncbi:hypothetical protein ACNT8L_05840 [Brucella intermedia]|uniref:hypothetical protein n=1 Tax=Brucella intermedia TaxID=94625 RepID=UPI003AB5391B